MTETPIGFGILGSGNMARVYGDALATQVDGGRLAAIAMGSRADGLAAEFGVDAEPSADALLAAPTSTSSSSPRPTRPTCRWRWQAAAAGKHVYLEKPMALDVAECDQIIDACQRAGVQLTIAKQTRHMEMSMRAKEYVDEGRIGDILFLRPVSVTPGPRLRQRARRAGRSTRARATRSSTGARMPATRSAGSPAPRRSASTPTTTTSPALPLESPTALVQIRLSNRAIAQILLCYEIGPSGFGTRRNNQYHDRRHRGLDLLGPRPGRALDGRPRRADLAAAELDAPRLQAARPAPDRQHGPPGPRVHRRPARRRGRRRSPATTAAPRSR